MARVDGTDLQIVHMIGDHLAVVEGSPEQLIACTGCGHVYGPKTQDPKLEAVVREVPITASSQLNIHGNLDLMRIREFFCPTCGTMIAANVQKLGDPVLIETELA